MDLITFTVNELSNLASTILEDSKDSKTFLFYGEMGAGKTTLIKELCKQLGVTDAVTSPTFSIVNEYNGSNVKIYHFDFYRLKNQSEALDIGFEEYLYSGNYCFIEWPEKIADLLPEHYQKITIEVTGNETRQLTVEQF